MAAPAVAPIAAGPGAVEEAAHGLKAPCDGPLRGRERGLAAPTASSIGRPRAAASRLRRDLRADDRDLGDRLQRPPRRFDPGRLGGGARPVALEARGCA